MVRNGYLEEEILFRLIVGQSSVKMLACRQRRRKMVYSNLHSPILTKGKRL